MNDDKEENLDNFLSSIEYLKKAKEILDEVWLEITPYGGSLDLSSPVLRKMRDFYNFDDSE